MHRLEIKSTSTGINFHALRTTFMHKYSYILKIVHSIFQKFPIFDFNLLMAEFSDCDGHNDSLLDYIPSELTKGKGMEGRDNKGKKALEPETRPRGGKKGDAKGGRAKNTGHDVTGNINKQTPHSVDSSGNGNTDNALPQSSVPGSNAQSEDEGTGCTHFKTVWGLRLDILLLTIVVLISAVIVKLPLGAQKVVTENPAIQQSSDLVEHLNAVKSTLVDLKSKVEAIEKVLNETDVQKVQDNAKQAKEMADDANVKLKTMQQHLFNKDALTAAILILFFLIIGLILYVLKLKSSLEPSLAGGSTSRPFKGSREMEFVLQKMPSRPTLDNAVCIVSFDASYSKEYKRMIKETVGQLGGVSFPTHVIRKHADIAELPHCRLYIMCVEFTERHVIIEEQGLGLGDLKLASYRGVRKLGGALVIMYIHDPGSRNLTDDQLYSDGVYCVKKQQELKELCEIDRFISAHNNLNTAQKKALETAIRNVLNIPAARH